MTTFDRIALRLIWACIGVCFAEVVALAYLRWWL